MSEFLTIKEASLWASNLLNKVITPSNISYLIQYGRIKKIGDNGSTLVSLDELKKYYESFVNIKENKWKSQLGEDLNWELSFQEYKESETTKHVHRLHPYKGKFIPQLVEYFLDDHVDQFKKEKFFKEGDIVLDPFCGSGTTLVQGCELGINTLGIDVSEFNTLISNCKVKNYNFIELEFELNKITHILNEYIRSSHIRKFELELLDHLYKFNNKYFPSPEYKIWINNNEINEKVYSTEKEKEFLPIYNNLLKKYKLDVLRDTSLSFLDKWYMPSVKNETMLVFNEIKKIQNKDTKKIASIILSRTIRSCRATTHSDLATLIEPITTTYYCTKHGKICKPLFSIVKWWETYVKDTIKRLHEFNKVRKPTFNICLTGDSRNINLIEKLQQLNPEFASLILNKKIDGIFTSPPYVGMIDYHEQHAYAYELYGFKRNDDLEIGPLFKGQGKEARQSYIHGISDVLNNLKPLLKKDFNAFLVANDKYDLYPEIAKRSGMKIVDQFKRPVLNRTEKDKTAYSEVIFHLKDGCN